MFFHTSAFCLKPDKTAHISKGKEATVSTWRVYAICLANETGVISEPSHPEIIGERLKLISNLPLSGCISGQPIGV